MSETRAIEGSKLTAALKLLGISGDAFRSIHIEDTNLIAIREVATQEGELTRYTLEVDEYVFYYPEDFAS